MATYERSSLLGEFRVPETHVLYLNYKFVYKAFCCDSGSDTIVADMTTNPDVFTTCSATEMPLFLIAPHQFINFTFPAASTAD